MDEALSIGHEVLAKWPHLDDIWLSMAEFYSADKNVTAVWQVCVNLHISIMLDIAIPHYIYNYAKNSGFL